MEETKFDRQMTLHDSGVGSFGSESDSSPVHASPANLVNPGSDTGEELHKQDQREETKLEMSDEFRPQIKRTFYASYLGESILDRRYTQPMLPWVMAEVRRRKKRREIKLEVLSHTLKATDCSSNEVFFEHQLHNLFRFAQVHQDRSCFAYLSRINVRSQFSCHVYQADNENAVLELFTAIREASKEVVKAQQQNVLSNEGRSVDAVEELTNTGCKWFEIMYIGKVPVSDAKTGSKFIDEAVEKFRQYEEQEIQMEEDERQRHVSGASVHSLPANMEKSIRACENDLANQSPRVNVYGGSTDSNLSASTSSSAGYSSLSSNGSNVDKTDLSVLSNESISTPISKPNGNRDGSRTSFDSLTGFGQDSNHHVYRGDTADEEKRRELGTQPRGLHHISHRNRTMLMQIGQVEMCLISPDKKSVILERQFKDISYCLKGIKEPAHFGFISREPQSGNFVCYVFRCADEAVAEEILQVLKQAFDSAFQENAKNHIVCELCPMHQLHKLCTEVEGLSSQKANDLLQRRVEQLPEKDHNEIMNKFKSESPSGNTEQVEVLMMLLRSMCESKQKEHTHISSSINKSQLKHEDSTQSAENVLSTSPINKEFAEEVFLSRKSPIGSPARSPARSPITRRHEVKTVAKNTSQASRTHGTGLVGNKNWSPTSGPQETTSTEKNWSPTPMRRPRSKTLGSVPTYEIKDSPAARPERAKSPAPVSYDTIHVKVDDVGNQGDHLTAVEYDFTSPKKLLFSRLSNQCAKSKTPPSSPGRQRKSPIRKSSFRMGILNRVVTPSRPSRSNFPDAPDTDNEINGFGDQIVPKRHLTTQVIRALWKKAILETLLLIRMEKENISLQARQDAAEVKRVKLDYEEIVPCLKEVTRVWDSMLNMADRRNIKCDLHKLHKALRDGVPQRKRGEIWELLVEQHRLHNPPVQKSGVYNPPDSDTPYEDLLKQLTIHQHAILIDLGRTFPTHPYFARQLGEGQLSLFNLLKAYSLVDPEVGYCQGLSFVAGILLMHMQEEVAFYTLKHILFKLGLRRQYRPDMVALQIQMYQLSRLLHDSHRDLYDFFEAHDIAPTLYAAPWFLTLFASQFPLGFVARVFDLIFLQGIEVLFKVAIVLLGNHKELIKQYDNLECIVEFLKTTLPEMGIIQMERVFNQVFQMDISLQLHAYKVEYHVLQEEMISNQAAGDPDHIARLEGSMHNLQRQNMDLLDQLQASHSQNHSLEVQMSTIQQGHSKLKSHIRTLELERAALLNAVSKLRNLIPDDIIEKTDINIPYIAPNVTITNSPIHNPIVNRLVEDYAVKLKSGTSLTELDKEVATLTAKRGKSPNRLSPNVRPDTGRPASSNY